MTDAEFNKRTMEIMSELMVEKAKNNYDAGIDMIFMKTFLSKLMDFLSLCSDKGETEVVFKREQVTEEPCNKNIRIYMDNDLLFKLDCKGFHYDPKRSSDSELFFFIDKNISK